MNILQHKNKQKDKDEDSYLIVSTTGIGDTLWGTPAISALKKAKPNCKITVLVSPLGKQVLKSNPDIDHIEVVKHSPIYFLKLFKRLKAKKFNTILVFHVSFRWLIPFCYMLRAKELIGFKRHAKDFKHLLSISFDIAYEHPILQRLKLLETLNIKSDDHQIKLFLDKADHKIAQDFLIENNLEKEKLIIGLQPGASQAFKQWPIEHFIELSKLIHQKYPLAKLLIVGNLEEASLADQINQQTPCVIASGKLSLRQSSALIKKMNLFITNDTGPMHLALAQQVPLVAIFSPTDHKLCWPHIGKPWVKVIAKGLTCSPCIGQRCQNHIV